MVKQIIKRMFKACGYSINKRQPPPRSGEEPSTTDAFYEQRRFIGQLSLPVIFDVGAHTGETVVQYKKIFPSAIVYAFEPFPDSFHVLQQKIQRVKETQCFNLGFSNASGRLRMSVNRSTSTNSLLSTDPRAIETWNDTNVTDTVGSVSVEVITLDEFLAVHPEIDTIDVLKLDTQGSEYNILQGGVNTARAGKIKLIYTEIIIMPTYIGQRQIDETLKLLRDNGFTLHNFFNPCFTNDGRINQVDAIFVRADLAKTN
jgi:FkbM family methyltransferase